ncbi:T9SS type A sorting domain-containing protein [Ekhidna sp. MALMAid0563]
MALGQDQRVKDDPNARVEYEMHRLIDPKTGKIPANIRAKELAFAKAMLTNGRISTLDGSTVWDRRGPYNVGGRTRALAVDSRDEDVILAGGVSGGMWRSTDGGDTWLKVLDESEIQSVTCIAQDPTTPDIWYYGTGELSGNSASGTGAFYLGDGIFKSTDNGETWSVLPNTVNGDPQFINLDEFEIVNEIVVHPSNGDVYAATYYGIFRSTNGGTDFSEVLDNPNRGWSDITVTSDGIFYASLEGDGVHRSEDGTSWTDITDATFASNLADGDRIELGLAPSAEDTLYIIAENGSSHSLWMYDDNDGGAASWTDRSTNIPIGDPFGGDVGDFTSQGGYDLLIKVKPDDPDFVVIGGTNLYRSTDGFATSINVSDWIGGYSTLNNISTYTNHHPDQHSFVFLSGIKALSGNDGGVQITNDITDITSNGSGETVDWIPLNNGYFTSQVYAVSVGPGNQIISGFQDNGNWLTNSTIETEEWGDHLVNFFGGDGTYNAISSDGTVRYISTQNARTFRVTYSTADDLVFESFQQIDPSSGYSGIFVTPFYLDPIDDDVFYLGGDFNLMVNTQASTATRTTGWKSIDLPGNSGFVSEIGVTTDDMVYVGTDVGELYKIEGPAESTPVVNDITSGLFPSGANISSIGVNQFNSDELMVVFSNYGVQSIFYTNDGGDTWSNISGDLEENEDGSGSGPSVRAARILGNGFEYLVGTSTGLYSTRTLDGTNTVWVQEGASNIGNVVVNHIATRTDGLVVVGTHGNGIYSSVVLPDNDLGVSSIDSPVSQIFEGQSDVLATVVNNGSSTINSFDITLEVDGVEISTEPVSTTLATGEQYIHTFDVQVDFTTIGSYDIVVSVDLVDDENIVNDSKLLSIESQANPTDISLSNASIDEEQPEGTTIGVFTTEDLDDEEHNYSLVEGDGSDDNSSFSILENELLSGIEFDFESKASFTIRVQTEDEDGYTLVRSFSINVNDIEEPLSVDDLNKLGIVVYPNPFGSKVYLEMINDYIGIVSITVSDIDGKSIVLTEEYSKQKRQTKSMLNLETLSTGIYILNISMGEKIYSGRLIKE